MADPTRVSPSRSRCSTARSAAAARRCERSNDTSPSARTIATPTTSAVQWIYTVHSEGAVVHGRAEDLKLARAYADRYEKAGGPQLPLVKQWVDYLENQGR